MSTLLQRWRRRSARSDAPLSFDDWASYFTFGGLDYPLGLQQTLTGTSESIEASFTGYVNGAYKRNGIVFAVMLVRLLLFSEARFQFRQLRNGRPGDLFGTKALEILETPWPNGTTGNLLTRMLQDADLAGNAYVTRRQRPGRTPYLQRLRPDWMTILMGSRDRRADPDTPMSEFDRELVGYSYQPGGPGSGEKPVLLFPDQVAHFAPIPDPEASYRGMSWLSPVINEVLADGAATTHKKKFFENGATPNMVVSLDPSIGRKEFEEWVKKMDEATVGVLNAYRTLYLGAGADAKVVGADMKQLDFKLTQGAGETRIAAAGGVPPVIVGLSEGLQAATYSNYSQARRRLADGTMRPLWREVAGSLAPLVDVPTDAQLWYDDRDISFLQEDLKDAAEIQGVEARTIRTLIDAGYTPDSVAAAVTSGDWSKLQHTGLFSVQLQPPGAKLSTGSGEPSPNGGAPALVDEPS